MMQQPVQFSQLSRASFNMGKIELSVILCLSHEHANHVDSIPNDVLQLISTNQLSRFNAKVAKYAASSKEEWKEQCKIWPTSYHPATNNVDDVCGFSEDESQSSFGYMKDAIRLAKSSYLADKVVNAAVIVDPWSKRIIANGIDQTCLRPPSTDEMSSKCIPCTEQTSIVASTKSDSNGFSNNDEYSLPLSSPDISCQIPTAVSCIHPWSWTEQRLYNQNNYLWHPLRHASLVAIENAAIRDRKLFPGLASSESQFNQTHDLQQPSNGTPLKRQKIQISDNDDNLVKKISTDGLLSESMRPYLCTGFDIYLVWEPCTMCAMALVHQRIRRIFYAFPNPNGGALGSVYRLQGEKGLNHHYSVFRIMVPERILLDA